MPRLFVAIDVPGPVAAELVALQPQSAPGVRLVAPGQMHLTLHYLGEADAERMGTVLAAVAFPAFRLEFEGVGQFPSGEGSITFWASVQRSPELLGLHGAVGTALTSEGFRPEARRYTPHVTLARGGPEVRASVVEDFLVRHAGFALPPVAVTEFALYSSTFVDDVPVYRRERSFPLLADGTGGVT